MSEWEENILLCSVIVAVTDENALGVFDGKGVLEGGIERMKSLAPCRNGGSILKTQRITFGKLTRGRYFTRENFRKSFVNAFASVSCKNYAPYLVNPGDISIALPV